MSMSRNALSLAQKSLPQLRLCNSMLVLPPTEHIVRGFKLERTPYKETFYLWRVVMPLFRMTLNYSKRIPRGDYIRLSKTKRPESASEVTKIISDDLPNLEKIRTPSDFFDHISWMIGNDTLNFLFDLAITYFLVGRFEDALRTLQQSLLAAERLRPDSKELIYFHCPSAPHQKEFRRTVDEFAAALKSSPQAAGEIVSEWERTNVAQYDLAETMLTA